MYKRIISPTLLAIALTLLLIGGVVLAVIVSSTNYSLSRVALDGSGGSMSSTNYGVDQIVGQVGAGSASSDNYEVGLGFWLDFSGGGKVYFPIVIKSS